MSEKLGKWPVDPSFASVAIWDTGVELAYKHNELVDVIHQHETWLIKALNDQENKRSVDRADNLLAKLPELRDVERQLVHIIGLHIGREGLVGESPYNWTQEQPIRSIPEDPNGGFYYFFNGEKTSV